MQDLLKADPLLFLYRSCRGAIQIHINDHTACYHGAIDEIRDNQRRNKNFKIPKEIYKEIEEANTLGEVRINPTPDTEAISFFGATFTLACRRALDHLTELGLLAEKVEPFEVNLTEKIEELADICNAAVHLDISTYKTPKYWSIEKQDWMSGATAKTFLDDERDGDPDLFVKGGDFGSPEVCAIMIERDEVMNIHFYPNTPVGFCSWYHTELDEMLVTGIRVAKEYKLGN
jgi:hypothetical protein